MKMANDAKVEERISENEGVIIPQNAKSGAYLLLEREASLHNQFL